MSKSLEKKVFWKKLISIPLVVLVLALIGYILLVAVYCIPTSKMEVQMKESCGVFEKEGSYISVMSAPNSKLDNFTDALMLLTASHPNTGDVWKDAVCASRLEKEGENTKNTLLYVFNDDGTDTYSISYARYWHGYLVFLKPLLLFFNYGQIRSLLMFLQLGLFLLVIVQIAEKNKKMVFPTFLVWIFLNPVANMLSLQFNSVTTVMFCAMLFILNKQEKHSGEDIYFWSLFFVVVGAMTSYLDLLTFPLLSLGIPLVLWLTLNDSQSIWKNICRIVLLSLSWAAGYVGMWVLKWGIGSIIIGENVVQNAVSAAQGRMSSSTSDTTFTYLDILLRQIKSSLQISWISAVFILILIWIVNVIKNKKINIHLYITYGLVAIFPLVWYGVLKNHSYIHHWFTYRELAISLYAGAACVMMQRNRIIGDGTWHKKQF